ncbi:hypothetical protein FA95DRAFT_1493450, partial [Auriscalpium vulgare]
SEYNDGKGIRFCLTYIPVLPALKAGEKRRKNAKPKPINCVFYSHEDSGLLGLLARAFSTALGNDDYLISMNRDGELRDTRHTVSYTIPRSTSKDMRITSVADYDELIEQVTKKDKPEVKLTISEQEAGGGGDEEDDEEDDEGSPRPKTKAKGLSKEERAQAEIIDNLRTQYACGDKSCPYDICYPDNENARHVHLTFQLLRLWSAAIVSELPVWLY